jgi:dTMP kinase
MQGRIMDHLRGKFIVFDGGEGCGKSTQALLLKEQLETAGLSALLVRDPGTTRIGELIRGILLNPDHQEMGMRCEMLLYMAARAQMMTQTILPALAKGIVVISDRFISSTLAYQIGGEGLSAKDINAVGQIAAHNRWPDLTIILDMDVESARVKPKFTLFPGDPDAGVEKDRIEQRSLEYHKQVRRNYLQQATDQPTRYRVIEADREKSVVHAEIVEALKELASS